MTDIDIPKYKYSSPTPDKHEKNTYIHNQNNDEERSYCVHFVCGHYIFPLDAVHPQEGHRFKPELLPNGDVLLRKRTNTH